jgi:hypothetical protein
MADTPEAVALGLMDRIAMAEGKEFDGGPASSVDREWILRTYGQCRMIVSQPANIEAILEAYPVPRGPASLLR